MTKLLAFVLFLCVLTGCVSEEQVLTSETYAVTVKGGMGTGRYPVGAEVRISIDSSRNDSVFSGWVSSDSIPFTAKGKNWATFIMPARDITYNPIYSRGYRLYVNHEQSNYYSEGERVAVSVSERTERDSMFAYWETIYGVDEFTIANNKVEFVMPKRDVHLNPKYISMNRVDTVTIYNPWAVQAEWGTTYTDTIALSSGVRSAVDLKWAYPIESSLDLLSSNSLPIYKSTDSAKIDLKVINNLERSTYVKPLMASGNGTVYTAISSVEVPALTLSTIKAKTAAAYSIYVDLSRSDTWYLGKLAGDRGYVLITGTVFPMDSVKSTINSGSVKLKFVRIPISDSYKDKL